MSEFHFRDYFADKDGLRRFTVELIFTLYGVDASLNPNWMAIE
jgi:hypothetical protein